MSANAPKDPKSVPIHPAFGTENAAIRAESGRKRVFHATRQAFAYSKKAERNHPHEMETESRRPLRPLLQLRKLLGVRRYVRQDLVLGQRIVEVTRLDEARPNALLDSIPRSFHSSNSRLETLCIKLDFNLWT